MTVRVRFAPSPTGFLHVGGARTALFNWLFARRAGGEFVLRVEDTDRARSSPEHTRAILDGLAWLGLTVDHGPVFQADGIERHRTDAQRLLRQGAAYRCFCTAAALARRREQARQTGAGYGYDGRCGRLDADASRARAKAGELFALRVRVPAEAIGWEDLIHGPMKFPSGSIDDFIVLRSDGTPVYNLAVVSDDTEARISHVIRGDDHISNTPKQILLYRTLGASLPVFGHVPLILGPDGKRLSKRHGAMSVLAYRDEGYLPEGMMNFLALLGWSPGDDREAFDVDGLIQAFSIDRVLRKSAVFDLDKLGWLNGRHIASSPAGTLAGGVLSFLRGEAREAGRSLAETHPELEASTERLERIIDLVKGRPRTMPALARQVSPFFAASVCYDEDAVRRFWKRPDEVAGHLGQLAEHVSAEGAFRDVGTLESAVRGLAERLGVGAGRVINPLRVALMGQSVSPGIFEVLEAMGRDRVMARLAAAVHEEWMRRALELAALGGERGEVPVAALVVDPEGRLAAETHNRTRELADPTAHAEVLALRAAAAKLGDWRLEGYTLYSTLEPCAMCAGAAVLARVQTLVFGAPDPKAGMCGSLENLVRDARLNHRVALVAGVLATESAQRLQEFFRARR
ncbi:glutamate--tRNA ligase [Candidatus Palauibacter sp.]|uniref:glutamate--tRNA ligase n=1 Tax=Candidatus Palauibacter sp. TaxID=3101350 RepID=UPI003AF247C6